MGEFRLFEAIVALSESSAWETAKYEWRLQDVFFAEDPETCLCGHYPIKELCVLINKYNNNDATVGNCCVKKFLNLPSDSIFSAVKRIRSDIQKSLNEEAISHAFDKGWINSWEYEFYSDTFRKRNLSRKQIEKKIQINEKILLKMSNRPPSN